MLSSVASQGRELKLQTGLEWTCKLLVELYNIPLKCMVVSNMHMSHFLPFSQLKKYHWLILEQAPGPLVELLYDLQLLIMVLDKSHTLNTPKNQTSVLILCSFVSQIEFVTGTKKGTNPSSTAASTTSNTITTTASGIHPPLQHLPTWSLHK